MVSGFLTSPYDQERISSGEAIPMRIFEKVLASAILITPPRFPALSTGPTNRKAEGTTEARRHGAKREKSKERNSSRNTEESRLIPGSLFSSFFSVTPPCLRVSVVFFVRRSVRRIRGAGRAGGGARRL